LEDDMRRRIALAVTAVTTAGLAALMPAAANADSVAVTATVGTLSGVLSVTTAPVAFTGSGSTLTSTPTATTVSDARLTTGLGWTLKVDMTDLTLVGATTQTSATTIPAGSVKMTTTTPIVAVPGTATVSDSYVSTALPLSNTAQTLMTATTSNVNTVTFIPTYTLTVPAGTTSGAYSGTFTETVS
jgi:hypothetical protein